MSDPSPSIAKTNIYHNIFNYTLNPTELNKYLITDTPHTLENHDHTSKNPAFDIQKNNLSWTYLTKAQKFTTNVLRKVPTILLVAVSGGTAALNATKQGDIDLLIITKPSTEWITRALVLTVTTILRQRININHTENNGGKFCFNMFLTTNSTDLLQTRPDIYTAMEIAHLKVILNRNTTFQKFLLTNQWIKELLANYWEISVHEWGLDKIRANDLGIKKKSPFLKVISIMNQITRLAQQTNYRRKFKRELTLQNTWEIDYREKILTTYNNSIAGLNL